MRHLPRRAGALVKAWSALALAMAGPILAAAPASAHPLGNFTVNHYNGITVHPDRIDDLAVVDSAEIPTLQARGTRDTSPAGVARSCTEVADHVVVSVDQRRVAWTVTGSILMFPPGAAGLPTSRLTCTMTAALGTGATNVTVADHQDADRIGWQEITAAGVGVRLTGSTVPARTVSDELRHYPNDLLASPLDVRDASFTVDDHTSASAGGPAGFVVRGAGPATRALERLNTEVDSLIGVRHLTIGVAALAILLSLVLGASHAALPGHGKTVMAAYLAGRGGGVRDAVIVGATVTTTHTAGVIILGLLLSASAGLAGEHLLGWLGVVSGLLILAIGTGLLRTAWKARRVPRHGYGHSHHGHHRHDQPHGTGHRHGHGHGDRHGHADHGHSHDGHGHRHDHADHADHADHGHSHDSHSHSHGRQDRHGHETPVRGRRALIGMGVAGGLVPSPSALVVLLGAVAIGRTVLGVTLVLAYGLGMAVTLTAAGLALVKLRHRLRPSRHARFGTVAGRLSRSAPVVTAALVLLVGVGLTVRSLSGVA